jgi:hypothetical protein
LKAAFFGYFLCGGKESNCRPAQGQRLRREGANADASEEIKTRMPAAKKVTACRPARATPAPRRRHADASEENKTRMPAQQQQEPTLRHQYPLTEEV